jgi:hypothetical protein
MSRRKTEDPHVTTIGGEPPQMAVIGVSPSVPVTRQDELRAARVEGRKDLEREVDEKIDQLRADAQALETAAKIVDAAWERDLPFPNRGEVAMGLRAMAAGIRVAADRIPHSGDCPF